MSKERKREVTTGLTPRSLIIGIALVIALSLYMVMGFYTNARSSIPEATPSRAGGAAAGSMWSSFWSGAALTFFAPLIVFVLLPKRFRLRSQELAVIFTMIVVTYPWVMKCAPLLYDASFVLTYGGPGTNTVESRGGWTTEEPFNQMIKWIAPYHFNTIPIVNDEVHRELLYFANGGFLGRPPNVAVPVRWDAFLPGLTFIFFEVFFLILMNIFLAAILRKQYVEIESLPFPNSTIGTTLVKEATTTPGGTGWFANKPKILSNKWLWLGFLVSQVLMIPCWAALLLPYAGVSDVTPFQVYRSEVKELIIPLIPITVTFTNSWALGFGLLMPVNVLLSWFITWIVFIVILTNVQWMAGIFPPPPENASMSWYVSRAINYYFLQVDPPGQGLCAWSWGILVAAAFYPMWVHRRHVIATIKAIWQPSPDLERGQTSYKWLYLGLLLSYIGYLALFAITPAAPYLWMTAISVIILMITMVGVSRFRAETGAYGGFWASGSVWGYRYPNHWWNRLVLKNLIGEPKPEGCATGENAVYYWVFDSCHNFTQNEAPPSAAMMPTMLESFKIAYETGTRPRDLIIASAIAIIVAYWVGNPIFIWLRHAAPWREDAFSSKTDILHDLYTGGIASRGAMIGTRGYWYMGYGAPNGPDVTNTLIQYAIGIVLGVILFWLRARYPSFIYNPFAIVMWGLCYQAGDFFVLFLLALIIKYFVIKTYGVLFYEQKIIPLAIGIIIGGAFIFSVDDILYWAFKRIFV